MLECWCWSVGVGSILPPMHVPGFLRQGCVFVVVVVGLGGEIESLGGENTIETERETALASFLLGLFRVGVYVHHFLHHIQLHRLILTEQNRTT